MSRPVWGAWIEIFDNGLMQALRAGRAPYGARGLKFEQVINTIDILGKSRPVWGAWIEILLCRRMRHLLKRRAPYGARGLKSYQSE